MELAASRPDDPKGYIPVVTDFRYGFSCPQCDLYTTALCPHRGICLSGDRPDGQSIHFRKEPEVHDYGF